MLKTRTSKRRKDWYIMTGARYVNARGAVMLEYVLIALVAITVFGVVVGFLGGDGGFFSTLLDRFDGLIEGAS